MDTNTECLLQSNSSAIAIAFVQESKNDYYDHFLNNLYIFWTKFLLSIFILCYIQNHAIITVTVLKRFLCISSYSAIIVTSAIQLPEKKSLFKILATSD